MSSPEPSTRQQRPSVRPAFSLLELVMVMGILAVLVAIAEPRYSSSLAYYQAGSAARRVAADLALASSAAYGSSGPVTVTFDPAAGTLAISGMAHLDRPGPAWLTELGRDPYGATVVSADFGGDASVIFDMYGRPDSSGQVVLQAGGVQRTISLDAGTGKAAIE